MAVGICRYQGGWRDHDSVLVRYEDGNEMEMSAETYQRRGIEPPLDQLPYNHADKDSHEPNDSD